MYVTKKKKKKVHDYLRIWGTWIWPAQSKPTNSPAPAGLPDSWECQKTDQISDVSIHIQALEIWTPYLLALSTMSLISQHLVVHSPSRPSPFNFYFNRSSTLSLSIALRQHIPQHPHFQFLKYSPLSYDEFSSFRTHSDPFHLRVYESEGTLQQDVVCDFNLDSLLYLVELACLLTSMIVSVGFAVNSLIVGSKKEFLVFTMGNKAMLWGTLMLVGGVVIGAWIRRRQWRLICKEMMRGGLEVNLLERIEKLEELRSSTTVVRALSRRLEKLGIRFRVTRKALKEPMTEVITFCCCCWWWWWFCFCFFFFTTKLILSSEACRFNLKINAIHWYLQVSCRVKDGMFDLYLSYIVYKFKGII